MPYIERTGVTAVKEQLQQWYHVMKDPRIDGFNGWGCKKKLYDEMDPKKNDDTPMEFRVPEADF